MASSRKSTSSKSYQEGPRKKLLRQRDHVEAQPTVENDKRRFTPKSNVVSKSKATSDSSKTPKVDTSKGKLTKKKMTPEERERSDKKPFSKEHTPPDIHSPAPPPPSSSSVASTSQGAEKSGISLSIAGKSSESSVVSSSSTVSAKGLPGDPTSTCNVGASTLKKSSTSVTKSTSGATMKKSSRMSQSESKKDSSRERKIGVVSCGPIHGSKSEQKATSKTKNAKVIAGESITSNLSSSAPVSNTSETKVSVKKSCSTESKNEPSKLLSGLPTGSSKDSNNATSSERSFYNPDHSSNVRLKRLIQEQAFDECEEDSISTSELNTSPSFSLNALELKKK